MKQNVDLNLYNVFIKVYELKNISKAAQTLYVSQPSISYSIKELEKQLGVDLFNRKSKGVEPTIEGEKLYYYISNALNIIHIGERKLSENNEKEEVVRIGVHTHICTCLLSKYIGDFSKIHPNIMFELIDLSTNSMVHMMESKKLDFIIDSLPIKSDKLNIEIINLKKLDTCILGNKKFICKNKKLELKDLSKFPFVLPHKTAVITKSLNDYLSNYSVKIEPYISIWTTEMMIDFVKKGMGVGYFIKDSVLDLIQNEQYFCEDFNNMLPKVDICLAYIIEFQSYSSKLFLNYLIEEIKKEK